MSRPEQETKEPEYGYAWTISVRTAKEAERAIAILRARFKIPANE